MLILLQVLSPFPRDFVQKYLVQYGRESVTLLNTFMTSKLSEKLFPILM